jgi:hypothetical protein
VQKLLKLTDSSNFSAGKQHSRRLDCQFDSVELKYARRTVGLQSYSEPPSATFEFLDLLLKRSAECRCRYGRRSLFRALLDQVEVSGAFQSLAQLHTEQQCRPLGGTLKIFIKLMK